MTKSGKTEPRDLFPGALEMMVLQSLRRQPMHGYDLVQHIKQRSNELLQVEEGSLYPALQRMLIKGWVVAEWKQTENNRRARYHTLTGAGRKQLTQELRDYQHVSLAIARVIAETT
jgi:PadR family transcriptional regulator PadR